ncbi:MAG TPA: WD40 repeat domain-containing protein, partial [Pirellulales bacterium]|nr:WD40 repeat domain-containing protein [Pirellulales bacterium]
RKADRYQSMQDMAEDLRAYLENRVVRAYQTGAWAELKKWVKRNRGLSIASGLAALVAVAGLLTVVAVQSLANARLSDANDVIREESRQKQQALEQQTLARQAEQEERRRAEGLYLARQSADVVEKNPGQALLLALKSHERRPSFEANCALLTARSSLHEARTFIGHRATVTAAALSPDRKRMVTVSEDHTAIIWDVASGEPVAYLLGHADRVRWGKFSPDGRYIATTSWDATAAIWDAATGQRRHVLRGHQGHLGMPAFSPDGRRLATESMDGTARIWDVESGEAVFVLRDHSAALADIGYSPDGRWLLTGSYDKTARIWDASSGTLQATLEHAGSVNMARFNSDGRLVLTIAEAAAATENSPGGRHANVCVWNVREGALVQTFEHDRLVPAASFSADGGQVITGCHDGFVRIWNTATGQLMRALKVEGGPVGWAALSPDQRLVAAVAEAGPVWLFDAATGTVLARLTGHTDVVESVIFDTSERLGTIEGLPVMPLFPVVAFSPNSARLAVGSAPAHSARLFSFPDGREIAGLRVDEGVRDIQFSPDNSLLATVSQSGAVRLWSAADGSPRRTLEGAGQASGVRFRGNSELVVVCQSEQVVATWNLESGAAVCRLELSGVESLYFSPNGRYVCGSLPGSGETGLWDTGTGLRTATWIWSSSTSQSQLKHQSSRNGNLAASWLHSGSEVQLWNAASGRLAARIDVGPNHLTSVAFSPEGRRLLAGCRDSEASLWDAQTGRLHKRLAGHETSAVTVSVGPDAERVVTRSADKVTRLWDGRTGESPRVLAKGGDWIEFAEFSEDGDSLLTMNLRRTKVVLWDPRRAMPRWELEGLGTNFATSLLSRDGKAVFTWTNDGQARISPLALNAEARRQMPRELTAEEVEMFAVGSDTERSAYADAWNLSRLDRSLRLVGDIAPDDDSHAKAVACFAHDEVKRCLTAVRSPATKAELARLLERTEPSLDRPADAVRAIRSAHVMSGSGPKNAAVARASGKE